MTSRPVSRLARFLAGLVTVAAAGGAAAALTITPLTWNVIGLDSNDPASGPRHFPVGARVCSNVATGSVVVAFQWESANAFIGLRPGSLSTIQIPAIAAGSCADAYFEVEVTPDPAAYDTARRYRITATDGTGPVATPTPRELFVEHLVSQARNGVFDVRLDGKSVPPGGTMTLLVGGVYDITLVGATATQGYNQLESFINFPNTIFRVLAVETTYSADTSPFVATPHDRLYADACGWQNNVASPNYRSCVGDTAAGGAGSDGKAGGSVSTRYTVEILTGGGTAQALNTLIYDFSGSSYHYNSDYAVGARIANIVAPAAPAFSKAFAPASVQAGGSSELVFTLANANLAPVVGVAFVDTLPAVPAQMTVAATPAATLSGCGGGILAATPGSTTITLSGAGIAANGACTVRVPVAVPAAPASGTYNNVTGPLTVNGTATAITASASLNVASAPPGTGLCGLTAAEWTFGTAGAPTLAATTVGAGVGVAALTAGNGLSMVSDTSQGSPAAASASFFGWQNAGPINTTTSDYLQFAVDTDSYSGVVLRFNARRTSAGPTTLELWYSVDGGATWTSKATFAPTTTWAAFGPYDFTGQANAAGSTLFRLYGFGANNPNSGSDLQLDQVSFTGCGTALPPTLVKSFSPNPVVAGGTSRLTFTLANANSAALTGAAFTDALPAGMSVASPAAAATTCAGATWAPVAGSTSLSFAGGTVPASGSCTAAVDVTAGTPGAKLNVSDYVTASESGPNTTATGSAVATLVVNAPTFAPLAAKSFAPATIAQNTTSTLTVTLNNPNATQSLSGIALSDSYPAGMANASPLAAQNGCGGTLTAVAGGTSFALAGGTLAAGTSCTIQLSVVGTTLGTKVNTTSAPVAVETVAAGTPASGTLEVVAPTPALRLAKKVRISPAGPWLDSLVASPGTPVDYQFIVENVGDVPFASFAVADPMLAGTGADPAGCAWQTGNVPSVLPVLPVASATLDPVATCVRGPVPALAGSVRNVATATGVYAAASFTSTDQATYLGASAGFTLVKEIAPSASGPWSTTLAPVAAGSNVHYRFTLVNNGTLPLAGLAITDPMVSTAACAYVDPLPVGDASVCVVGPIVAAGAPGATVVNTAFASATAGGAPLTTPNAQASYTLQPAAASADVAIVKSLLTPAPFFAGQSVAYSLVVSNAGPDTATGVQVTDVPANLVLTAVSGAGCAALPCTLGSLAAGASVTINVTATVSAAGAFDNAASVMATEVDPNPANNVDNSGNGGTATVPTGAADLAITKTDGVTSVTAGTTTVYTIHVINNGPDDAANATLSDALPAGTTFVALSAPAGWTCATPAVGAPGSVQCSLASLPSGASATFTLTAAVDATLAGGSTLANTAVVASTTGDPNPVDNAATDTDTVVAAPVDLSVTKTDGASSVTAGAGTLYTIVVANAGPGPALSVAMNDVLPAGTTFASLTAPAGWTCTTPAVGAGGTVACTRASLPAGATQTFLLAVNIGAGLPAGTTLANTATVSTTSVDTNAGNDSATDVDSVIVAATSADLSVTKTGPATFGAGTIGSYAIVVANAGPDAAADVVVTDTLPAGTTFASLTAPAGWTCTTPAVGAGGTVSCTRPTLAQGASAAFSLSVNVGAGVAGGSTLANTATATSTTPEPVPGNNSATHTGTVNAVADLSVTKSDAVTSVASGAATTYVVTVANAGPATVTGATLVDAVAAGLAKTAVTCSSTPGRCVTPPTINALESGFVLPTLASGETYELRVTATVTAASGQVSNQAVVTPPSGIVDPVPGNNTAVDTDTVTAVGADLAIAKTSNAAVVAPGGAIVYTLTISNLGPGEAGGVTVQDVAPPGLVFGAWSCAVQGAGSGGTLTTACVTGAGIGDVVATLDMKAGAVITITLAATVSPAATGPVTNVARVSAPGSIVDPVTGNNASTQAVSVNAAPATPVPTLSQWALWLLSLAVALVAWRARVGRGW